MVKMVDKRRWKTKPLECWTLFKEGTVSMFKHMGEDKKTEEKELLVIGSVLPGMARGIAGHPFAAQVAGRGLAAKYCDECELKGYGRSICGYARIDLGCMLLHEYPFGGPMPEPDFVSQQVGGGCDDQRQQLPPQADYHHVPLNIPDNLQIYEWDSEQTKKNKMEYHIAQTLENIEWWEKQTGKKLDDELFIKDAYEVSHDRNLAGQILLLNQNIPATLDEKTMFSLLTIGGRGERGTGRNLLEILRDEVQDRVNNQIAAVGTERYRVMTYSLPPWYALNIYRYMEQYGVVSVGSRYLHNNAGGLATTKSGIDIPVPTYEQLGIVLKTREDVVRAQALPLVEMPSWQHRFGGRWERENQLRLFRQWHCDGVVLHQNLSCRGTTLWAPQVRLAFLENNISVVTYQGTHSDPRDWDEARAFSRLDAFFESQGLEKLV